MFNALRERVRRPRREETLPEPDSSFFDDDPALGVLAQELGELGGLELSAAPRERTLALVRQEVRAQEARGAFSGGSRSIVSRVVLGGAALLVAASLGLFALAGGLGDGDRTAGGSSTSDTLVAESGGTTDTQSPDTTGVPHTTGASVPGTVTSQAPVTTVLTMRPGTDNTATTATTADRPAVPSPPSSARPRTTTTVAPGTTTTTGGAVLTWEDREDSARTVVLSLADKVITETLSGVDAYVASNAKSGLAWMIASLERPSSARIVAVRETSSGARVLLEMIDNVSDGQGDLAKVQRRFYLVVSPTENGALITAISAGPTE